MTADPYRIVLAGGQRLNIWGSTDPDDAIRIAREHWTECRDMDIAALDALDQGTVTVERSDDG